MLALKSDAFWEQQKFVALIISGMGQACVSGVLRNYRVNILVVYVENKQHPPDRTRRYGVQTISVLRTAGEWYQRQLMMV